jgi:hypothetical protein
MIEDPQQAKVAATEILPVGIVHVDFQLIAPAYAVRPQ